MTFYDLKPKLIEIPYTLDIKRDNARISFSSHLNQ